MKTFLKITSVAVMGLFLFAGCRGGFGPCGHHGYGHHRLNPEKVSARIAAKLNMDKEQKVKLNTLVKKTFDQMPEFQKKHALVIDELIKQFESDSFDAAAVNKVMSDMEIDMKKAKEVMLASGSEFHAMLKPEQKAKIVEKLKRHKIRMADRISK